MKIAVLGLGAVGKAFIKALSEDRLPVDVRLCDVSEKNLEEARAVISDAEIMKVDLTKVDDLMKCLDGVDLVIDALPSRISFNVLKSCASRCIDTLSIAFIEEDPYQLHQQYVECRKKLVVDAGVAPGLSNIIAGRIATLLDEVDELTIYVGGIPVEPVGVLKYVITWSAEDLIEEYIRKARIVKEGRIEEVDPLQHIETVEIPDLGVFEAFYSDGLRTMLKTLINKVKNMYEKTIRWPGHLEKIKLLRDLGFFDSEPIDYEGVKIVPKLVTAKILEKKLRLSIEDMVVLYIVGRGWIDNEFRLLRYLIVSRYDRERKLSAMAKITGFTAYAIAKVVFVEKKVEESGVIPPEILGFREDVFVDILSYLVSKGIELKIL